MISVVRCQSLFLSEMGDGLWGWKRDFRGAAAGGQHEAAMRSSGKNERITRNSFVKKERGVKSGHAEHTNFAAVDLARGLVKCQNGWGCGGGG